MATKSKNTMIPFSRGTLAELQRGLADGYISSPALHFLTEDSKKCLAFVDVDGKVYEINVSRLDAIEQKLAGMVDPSTGQEINVTEYVQTQSEAIAETAVSNATSITVI